jgi:hypothetical protein
MTFYMPRILFTIAALLWVTPLFSQSNASVTESFTITGKVKATLTVTTSDLQLFRSHTIGDVKITNHKGEEKGTASKLSGVLLKDIVQAVMPANEDLKLLSEYYFVCQASDGYKVVYSWNELFNTATGNNVYLVTSKEDKHAPGFDESILMISTQDLRTGRRYLKNLKTIYVGRAE